MSENRTKKYLKYAIGEIILVVIGILIALSINNWNEYRNDRKKEAAFIKELRLEFSSNKRQLAKNTKEHEKRYQAIEKAVELLPIDLKTVNLDSLSEYINDSIGYWTFEPSQGTINALVNGSNLELIQNDELRQALVSWQSVFDDYHEDELKANRYSFDYFFPFIEKHFDWSINFNDPRTDLKMLESFEFENRLLARRSFLIDILYSEEKELEKLSNLIETIINLTQTYD